MFFPNEDKLIIPNDYEEKSWSVYIIWKNHPSKKWDYSSFKNLLKKFRETGLMHRRHGSGRSRTVSTEGNMDLIRKVGLLTERAFPYVFSSKLLNKQESVIREYGEW